MKEKLHKRSYWLTPAQAQYITKVALKKGIKESQLMRHILENVHKDLKKIKIT